MKTHTAEFSDTVRSSQLAAARGAGRLARHIVEGEKVRNRSFIAQQNVLTTETIPENATVTCLSKFNTQSRTGMKRLPVRAFRGRRNKGEG